MDADNNVRFCNRQHLAATGLFLMLCCLIPPTTPAFLAGSIRLSNPWVSFYSNTHVITNALPRQRMSTMRLSPNLATHCHVLLSLFLFMCLSLRFLSPRWPRCLFSSCAPSPSRFSSCVLSRTTQHPSSWYHPLLTTRPRTKGGSSYCPRWPG
jgi:hypothetical protein